MKRSLHSQCVAVCVVYLLVFTPTLLHSKIVPFANFQFGSAEPPVTSGQAVKVVVPDGTRVELELTSTIVGKNTNVGSRVDFTVVQAVKVNGRTVIDRGASAWGKVTNKKKGRRWGRAGKLEIALEGVTGVDGRQIPIRGEQSKKGGNRVVLVVVLVILLFPIGLLFGLLRGGNARIPAGTKLSVSVQGDYEMSLP